MAFEDPTLWENDKFIIQTPLNPHLPNSEGLQLIVWSKQHLENAWQNPELGGEMFTVAAKACRIMEELEMAPWFNIGALGNWGLLPGRTPSFHIHIYGRNKTASWAKPLVLPEAPGTYHNEPMPESDRNKLIEAGR